MAVESGRKVTGLISNSGQSQNFRSENLTISLQINNNNNNIFSITSDYSDVVPSRG